MKTACADVIKIMVPVSEACAVRTWKRDGSQNLMTLKAAANNIARNMVLPLAVVYKRLRAGEVVETRHAQFSLET